MCLLPRESSFLEVIVGKVKNKQINLNACKIYHWGRSVFHIDYSRQKKKKSDLLLHFKEVIIKAPFRGLHFC